MSWLEVNWTQERPSEAAAAGLWQSIEIRPLEGLPKAIQDYLSELRRVNVNGDVAYSRFEVNGNLDFTWFATRNRWDEIAFFSRFLSHSAVRGQLPELTSDAKFEKNVSFEWGNSLILDGELARTLVIGGAYKKYEGTPRAAKELGASVCEALFDDRYLDVEVFRCWKAWSPWFYDVAWDSTCFLIDRRLQTVTLLASTDTD